MSISRDELVNIFSVVSFLAHAERDVHVAEKKVLIAVFKAAGITQEEQKNNEIKHFSGRDVKTHSVSRSKAHTG